jgi:hypothetical protein
MRGRGQRRRAAAAAATAAARGRRGGGAAGAAAPWREWERGAGRVGEGVCSQAGRAIVAKRAQRNGSLQRRERAGRRGAVRSQWSDGARGGWVDDCHRAAAGEETTGLSARWCGEGMNRSERSGAVGCWAARFFESETDATSRERGSGCQPNGPAFVRGLPPRAPTIDNNEKKEKREKKGWTTAPSLGDEKKEGLQRDKRRLLRAPHPAL